jgi:HK97 family phage prohead protease
MSKKWMQLEIKEISAEGSFEGLLSPYGLPADAYGDVVEPGAYTKTMREHGNTVPMLWQHKTDTPIGELTLVDRADGLWCKGQLLMALPDAQKAYLLIKARIVKGLSIGYDSVKDAIESGIRHLKEIRLWEGSVVTFPAALQALITSVKSLREAKEDFNSELAEIQLQDMGYQMFCALRCSLGGLPWASGMTRDQKVTAAEVTLQQFSEAFLAYLPAYIDYLAEEYGQFETMSAPQREFKAQQTFQPRAEQAAVEPTQLEAAVTLPDLTKALAEFVASEAKAGRTISAATKATISTIADHMKSSTDSQKSAFDLLLALIADEADSEDEDPPVTSETKAAEPPKSEPVIDHSAAKEILKDMRSFFRAA